MNPKDVLRQQQQALVILLMLGPRFTRAQAYHELLAAGLEVGVGSLFRRGLLHSRDSVWCEISKKGFALIKGENHESK